MNTGPFGYPRLSSIGPFTEEDLQPDNFDAWVDSLRHSSKCDKVSKMLPEIEVVALNPTHITPVYNAKRSRLDIVKGTRKAKKSLNKGETVLYHETYNGEEIMQNGFDNRDKFLFIDTPIRENGAFFWIHMNDIGQRWPDMFREDGNSIIVCKANISECHAYTAMALQYINSVEPSKVPRRDEYDDIFSVPLETYIDCIKSGVSLPNMRNNITLAPNNA